MGSGPFEVEKVSGSGAATETIASDSIWGATGGVGEGSVTMTAGPASMMGMGELSSVDGDEDETVLFSAALTGTIAMGTLGARGDTGVPGSTAEEGGGAESEASSAVTGTDS
jgi:hypothetical protein